MTTRIVASLAVVILAGLAPPALAAPPEKPKHKDPVELWKRYPIGTPTVPAEPQPSEAPSPKPTPATVSPSSSATPTQASPSSSFPVAAVVGGLGGVLALGLLTVVLRGRRKQWPGGTTRLRAEPQLSPSGYPFSIVPVGPTDVESSFSQMLQPATGGVPPSSAPLAGKEPLRLVVAVATDSTRWNTVVNQSASSRRDPVSDGLQEEAVVVESPAQPGEDVDTSGGDEPAGARPRVDIGEHINEIIRSAEEAARWVRDEADTEAADIRAQAHAEVKTRLAEAEAEAGRLRDEAEAYAAETRQVVDAYATQKRREAEAEAGRTQSEAESQARAVREASEEMAEQIEAEARQTQSVLREETRAIEARLDRLLRGVRETGSQLETLLHGSRSNESLVEALGVDRHRMSAGEQES